MELTYLVRGPDGKEYGPASLEELTAWIREGRILPQQEVRRSDMQTWSDAAAFMELQPAFGSAPASSFGARSVGGQGSAAVATAVSPASVAHPNASAAIAQMKSGGSWFFWVAGLSLVNTFAALSGGDWRFFIGLGITQVFDLLGSQMGGSGKVVALGLDLLAAGAFVGFGVFANRGHAWAFIVGMVLIALDGVIFLVAQDWIGVGFHVFVIYCLFRGFSACRQLRVAGASTSPA